MGEPMLSVHNRRPDSPVSVTRTDGFSAFGSAASASFVPLDIKALSRTESESGFSARLRAVRSEDIHFTEVSAGAHVVERNEKLIARGGSGMFKVGLLLRGSGLLTQDNREVLLQRGDIVVYDTDRPYTLIFDDDVSNFVMMFPKSRLDLPERMMNQLTATSLTTSNSLSSIVSPYLGQLATHLDRISGSVGAKLARHSVDLVGTLFASVLNVALEEQDPRQVLLGTVREYIEENLSDPELGPSSIAAAHYISTRHLHGLFQEQDTSISRWIRVRRLERCSADLVDPLYRSRPISAVAARWGFVDASHFSRIYKTHFGESPSDVRAR